MLLNFAVVGGGPTGIEWSAELCDMIEEDMSKLYPELKGYAKVGFRSFVCLCKLLAANNENRSQSTTSPPKSSACSTKNSATTP
jgi:hypothetical protein